MSGLLLRLAGPVQAWGERGVFHRRDTSAFPTRSALIGMFAAAQGRTREHALDPYPHLPGRPDHRDLTITIRIDQPGTRYRDFHTVGGGYGPRNALRTGNGTYRPEKESTLVSHRDYLIDACFTVAVEGPAPLIAHIAETLEQPRFGLFLGRRSCLPDEPLVLRHHTPDPIHELKTAAPLTRNAPPRDDTPIPVTFVWEHPPPHATNPDQPDREATSEPIDLTTGARRHLPRPLWLTTEPLPAGLHTGPRPLDALAAYKLGAPA
ncbi:type I-E CRISPR-associated protein Cas5/CasD [Streptomyces wuyuanensis]|uniref:CRISPR system Cascade subunit CasD n=1 Tax=Streptomyces wuyuanensis TaxID=1196353 RepID=A0A1H0DT26_9ACTN|nr:type I-E CRISPR-associated protein Cas5/CasD [Streptomyces wuyuanensis]SDN73397.1 CRISPR system Cascade subunit CasD [Streptomyces wuyuanensis]